MTDNEKFLFDLWGYVVIEDVLTPDEIALANEAVDRHTHLIRQSRSGLIPWLSKIGRGYRSRGVSSQSIDL